MNKSLVLSGFVFVASMGIAAKADMVYSNDFSTSVADFTETTGSQWVLGGGVYTDTMGPSPSAASVALVDVAAVGANDFSMTTTFNILSYTGTSTGTTLGFAAMSANNSASGAAFILADTNPHSGNAMRILLIDPANANIPVANGNFSQSYGVGGPFTLTLAGAYSAGDLNLSLTLDDGTNPAESINGTLSAADLGAATLGDYFGFRNRTVLNGPATVAYNELTISAIPEPSSLALFCGSLVGLAMFRRFSGKRV